MQICIFYGPKILLCQNIDENVSINGKKSFLEKGGFEL